MILSLFLDISLLAIIVITVLICRNRGFVRSISGLVNWMLCMVMSYLFGPTVSAWVSKSFVMTRVTDFMHNKLTAMFEAGAETFDLSEVVENLPSWLTSLFGRIGVDLPSLVGDFTNQTQADNGTLSQLAAKLAQPIAKLLSDLIAYAGIFLLSMLLFGIAIKIMTKIVKLPVVRRVDRVLGLLLGIVRALIYSAIYTLLTYAVMSLVETKFDGVAFHQAFENTWLFRHCFNFNILRWIFGIGM